LGAQTCQDVPVPHQLPCVRKHCRFPSQFLSQPFLLSGAEVFATKVFDSIGIFTAVIARKKDKRKQMN
jgi:hypothetical protein